MPPRTQYLPVTGISPTDPWISQTDDERTAREARMSASYISLNFIHLVKKVWLNYLSNNEFNFEWKYLNRKNTWQF